MGKAKKRVKNSGATPVGVESSSTVTESQTETVTEEEYNSLLEGTPVGEPEGTNPEASALDRIHQEWGVEDQGQTQNHQSGVEAITKTTEELSVELKEFPSLPEVVEDRTKYTKNRTPKPEPRLNRSDHAYWENLPEVPTPEQVNQIRASEALLKGIGLEKPPPMFSSFREQKPLQIVVVKEILVHLKYEGEPFPAYTDTIRFFCDDYTVKEVVQFFREHLDPTIQIALHRYYSRIVKVPGLLDTLFKSRRLLLKRYLYAHFTYTDVDRVQLNQQQALSLFPRVRLTPWEGTINTGRYVMEATLHLCSLPPVSAMTDQRGAVSEIKDDVLSSAGHERIKLVLVNLYRLLNRSRTTRPKGAQNKSFDKFNS